MKTLALVLLVFGVILSFGAYAMDRSIDDPPLEVELHIGIACVAASMAMYAACIWMKW